MEIAIVSDTHVPSRARRIPDPFRERIRAADHVLHAGDFDAESTVADVRDLADTLTAVRGNTDPAVGLPEVATVELGGVSFVVTHGTGSKRGYEDRVARLVREHGGTDAVGISGHTHEVLDTTRGGVRLLNPGSATAASPATSATMLTATAADGDLTVRRHEL
ncbi:MULTISPECIES: metallophosphoesterase family protein [Halomicrobium]|uniref:Phosphoesterase n=2 Tax=Halomicrobium mukohataei TaxID=57705 RepID=C7NXP4_HALMD|nr:MULTISPECIES: metallophosphoesterase family protein [Halomicrobium]ACV46482.1 phosphodiesterase, MJ0936 family [Halomicrobium mukohataei DSM 12286]QCD65028.1 metallophosphoesterase family protein [Halomicrobium mukohataei]QFR19834.1 YfcE family phosphodiesterase [Halomicrobium sp. ZPS1]